jgi:hypothetical protein
MRISHRRFKGFVSQQSPSQFEILRLPQQSSREGVADIVKAEVL